MPSDDDIIADAIDSPSRDGVSMDVLLQLTLPIVLILAFLVVTEVQTLTEEIQRLEEDVRGTAHGATQRGARKRDLGIAAATLVPRRR